MGKSFNDDVFNNGFNLDSINGLNISKEAIQENKNSLSDISKDLKEKLGNVDIDKIKEEIQASKKENTEDDEQELKRLQDEMTRLKEKEQQRDNHEEKEQQKEQYVKKTMIFKQDYLDIIDGLASINDMQIKDVLNQLLEKSINMLDDKTKEKALKTGKKAKPVKQDKSIF